MKQLHPNNKQDLYDKIEDIFGEDELSEDGRKRLDDLLGEEHIPKQKPKKVVVKNEDGFFNKIKSIFDKIDSKIFKDNRNNNNQFHKRDKGERWWT